MTFGHLNPPQEIGVVGASFVVKRTIASVWSIPDDLWIFRLTGCDLTQMYTCILGRF